MKNLITLAIATTLLLFSSACGGGADALSDQAMDATKDFVTLLEGIDSKESAEAAAPEFKKVTDRMKALREKMEALPEEKQKELEAAMESGEEGKALQKRMMDAMGKLMTKPDVAQALAPIMAEMGN